MPTYKLISSQTLSSTTTSITFSSIPSTYTDLLIKVSARSARTNDSGGSDGKLQFNGDTGTNYGSIGIFNASGSVLSFTNSNIIYIVDSNTQAANTFGSTEFYISNYTSSNYKSVGVDTVAENTATTNYQFLVGGIWNSTSAITSLTLTDNQGGYLSGSTFYLYGISKS